MEEKKKLISKNDEEILDKAISLNEYPISDDEILDITIEMHVYDLSDNKIASVHQVPDDTWELYDGQVEEEEERQDMSNPPMQFERGTRETNPDTSVQSR